MSSTENSWSDTTGKVHAEAPQPSIDVAIHAQNMSEDGNADPFPPEGTDDKLVQSEQTGDIPLTDEEGLRAARYVVAAGLGSGLAKPDLGPTGLSAGSRETLESTPDMAPLTADTLTQTVAATPPSSKR